MPFNKIQVIVTIYIIGNWSTYNDIMLLYAIVKTSAPVGIAYYKIIDFEKAFERLRSRNNNNLNRLSLARYLCRMS